MMGEAHDGVQQLTLKVRLDHLTKEKKTKGVFPEWDEP
tara:strand:- start:284 stop:397 length:114 start_codon:yes stop_codon:yes gene_type:complete